MTKKSYTVELPSGLRVSCESSKDLRSSLKDHFNEIYNQNPKFMHCRGLGTCGTCSMQIEGSVSKPTKIEKWRLNFPPHKNSDKKKLRLLCQCVPLSNLKLKKLKGLWGNSYD